MRPDRLRRSLSPLAAIAASLAVVALVAAGVPGPERAATAPTTAPATPDAAQEVATSAPTGAPEPSAPWLTVTTPVPTRPPIVASEPDPTAAPIVVAVAVDSSWHIPVLTYHLIATPSEAGSAMPSLVVSPALFDAQLRTLRAAGWRTITAATLAHDLASGHRPGPRTLVITIDDGHVDGWTEAFPILQRHGFVATYYMVTGRTGMSGGTTDGYLTRDQLVALAAAGMEIGDHTVDHVPLASRTQADALAEMAGAADWIEANIGTRPTTLAYPFGSFDQAVVDDAASLGFSMAFTTVGGCREAPTNRLAVPRFHVGPGMTPLDLLALVAGCNG